MAQGALGLGGANPNSVQAALSGGGFGGSSSSSTSGTGIVPGMMDLYNQTLSRNAENYQNVLGAYNQGSQGLQASLPGIYALYGTLNQQIGKTLGQGGDWGVATPAAQAISQAFATQQGTTQQQMINAGLGNTTALANATNQNTLLAGQAYGGLGAQLAQTYAGYEAQTGEAELAARMQGLGMQTNLAEARGRTLAGLQQPLPNITGGFSTSQSANRGSLSNQYPTGFGGGGGRVGGGGGVDQGTGGSTFSGFTSASGAPSGYNPLIGSVPKFGGSYSPGQPTDWGAAGGGFFTGGGTMTGGAYGLGGLNLGNDIAAAQAAYAQGGGGGYQFDPNVDYGIDAYSGE